MNHKFALSYFWIIVILQFSSPDHNLKIIITIDMNIYVFTDSD